MSIFTKGQIVVDNNIPYNDPTSLVDNILLRLLFLTYSYGSPKSYRNDVFGVYRR